jgi:hypothetical protein
VGSEPEGEKEPEDEQMTTQTSKTVSNVARVVAVGLLSLAAIGSYAQDANAQSRAPKLMGHIEVTAPRTVDVAIRDVPAIESVPMIGSMTVTATRLTTVVERNKQPASAGEPTVRTKSPRAVLVQ